MSRRILYIDHYVGSPRHGMEYRPYYLAREWMKLGHYVEIVGASFAHCRSVQPDVSEAARVEVVDGVPYRWLPTPSYHGNGLGRVANMGAFIAQLLRFGSDLAKAVRPDVVIASSTYPADIFPAARIARRCGAQLIFELHDLWPLSPMQLGNMSRWHPFIMFMQSAEDYACQHADAVVSILPAALAHLRTRGLRPDRFFHVPNGIVIDEWSASARQAPPAEFQAALEQSKAKGRFVLMYAGAHGVANDLDTLIDAAAQLRDLSVDFYLIGHGPDKQRLQRKAAALGADNVKFLSPVPKKSIPSVLESADALVFTLAGSPLFQFGISPNKLIDYMMAGRPILSAMTAANDPVAEHQCGLSCPSGDVAGLAASVRKLLAMPEHERAVMGVRGREAASSTYEYGKLARRFAAVFEAKSQAKTLADPEVTT